MPIELPPLPYPEDALAPVISAETLAFHYGKHHRAYVTNVNNLTQGGELADAPLETIIRESRAGGVFNNAAQVWNHTFYWNSMHPDGGGEPSGALRTEIEASFGSVDACMQAFAGAAKTLFGSGWTWLVREPDGKVGIEQTSNADLPLVHGKTALLTLDVWEHAYYIDYRNARADYVDGWLESLANWEFAGANFEGTFASAHA